ncbi:hypothetical protein MJO29_013792 [Puccinia striiformis f. sp. tritici]|nr:hypothetical protein MJO29_013792 [Puccinia striiformis f. sp. tritici]
MEATLVAQYNILLAHKRQKSKPHQQKDSLIDQNLQPNFPNNDLQITPAPIKSNTAEICDNEYSATVPPKLCKKCCNGEHLHLEVPLVNQLVVSTSTTLSIHPPSNNASFPRQSFSS